MIITMDEYIQQFIAPLKEDLSAMDIKMVKGTTCHKYYGVQAEYMQVEYDEELDLNSFTPLSQQAFDEIEVNE